jgi:hypothetical protein
VEVRRRPRPAVGLGKNERDGPGSGRPGPRAAPEFIYKYAHPNTVSNPDGTPNGFAPDPSQFVLHTNE